MQVNFLSPPQAFNKAFLKVKPNRSDIKSFQVPLNNLLEWMIYRGYYAFSALELRIDQLGYQLRGYRKEEISYGRKA